MKKRLASIIIISIVSSLTAILLIRVLNNFSRKPTTAQPYIEPPKKDTVSVALKPKANYLQQTPTKDSLTIKENNLENDAKALREIIKTQNFLNNNNSNFLNEFNAHYESLTQLYKLKGLNPETNRQLKLCLKKMLSQRKKKLKKSIKSQKGDSTLSTKDSIIYK
jgi:hypothetical protein